MKKTFLIILWITLLYSFAQQDSTKSPFSISACLENYYGYDFAHPDNHNRPNFTYSYNRHNEVNLNLGFIKTEYVTQNTRANIALMTGTYTHANLAHEPDVFKNIFEANAGLKISKNKNIWIDGGVFPSHIGFESAIGKDCWNVTRSILADNSPYYESGVKASYTSQNEKWFLSGLVLNGWQRIRRVPGNNTPAFGHQITYKPYPNTIFNSSSFVGNVLLDTLPRMRYFHNFYTQTQLTKKFGTTVGFDIGAQSQLKQTNAYSVWYSVVCIVKYSASSKINLATRMEYYSDPQQALIQTSTPSGFQVYGYSLNFDYQITTNALWRIEARGFTSKDKIFTLNKIPSTQNYLIIATLSIFLHT